MKNTLATFLGKKGSGKTTLVKECLREHSRVLAFDINGEYRPEDGLAVVWGFEECLEAMERIEPGETFAYSLRCVDDEEHDAVEDYLDLMRVAFELPGTLLVLEECNNYCSSATLPWELARLVRQGRHREIDQYYVARRPSELHRDLTANSDFVVTFRQEEPRDVLYLRERMGPELAERARTLADYQIIVHGDLDVAPTAVLKRMIATTEARSPGDEVEDAPPDDLPSPGELEGVESELEGHDQEEP